MPKQETVQVDNKKSKFWEIVIEPSQEFKLEDLDVTRLLERIFIYHRMIYDDKTEQYIACCESNTRQRIGTIENKFIKVIDNDEEYPPSLISMITVKRWHGKIENYPFNGKRDEVIDVNYSGDDIKILDVKKNRFPWQNRLLELFYNESKEEFIPSDPRSIIWITDKVGCTGKSKFVKWMSVKHQKDVVKLTFGSPNQLRSGIISACDRKLYFIDLPRTRNKAEDNLDSLI